MTLPGIGTDKARTAPLGHARPSVFRMLVAAIMCAVSLAACSAIAESGHSYYRVSVCDTCRSILRANGRAELVPARRYVFVPRDEVGQVQDSMIVQSGLVDNRHVHSWQPIVESVDAGEDGWMGEDLTFPTRNSLVERLDEDASCRSTILAAIASGALNVKDLKVALEFRATPDPRNPVDGGLGAYDRILKMLGGNENSDIP